MEEIRLLNDSVYYYDSGCHSDCGRWGNFKFSYERSVWSLDECENKDGASDKLFDEHLGQKLLEISELV